MFISIKHYNVISGSWDNITINKLNAVSLEPKKASVSDGADGILTMLDGSVYFVKYSAVLGQLNSN